MWEKGIIGEIGGNDRSVIDEKQLVTTGILFHYVILSGVVAVTVGFIAQEISDVVTSRETITFGHLYVWISILFTNMVTGIARI